MAFRKKRGLTYFPSNATVDYALPINSRLGAWWPLNDGAGSFAKDISGRGRIATLANFSESQWTHDAKGKVIGVNGSNQEAVSQVYDSPVNPLGFSASIWVNPTTTSNYQVPIAQWNETGSHRQWAIAIFSGGTVYGYYSPDGSSANNLASATNISTGAWSLLTFTIDVPNNNMTLYINGKQTAQAGTGTIHADTQPVYIGNAPVFAGSSAYYDGLLWNARLWNRALTAKEVEQLYLRPLSGLQPSKINFTSPAPTIINVNLSGVAGSGQAGSLLAATNLLTGVHGTGQAGSLEAWLKASLSGVHGSGAAGTISTSAIEGISLTGVSGTGLAGTIIAKLSQVNSLQGVYGVGRAGSLSVFTGIDTVNINLTGVTGYGQAGSLAMENLIQLIGVHGTGSAGTLSALGTVDGLVMTQLDGNQLASGTSDIYFSLRWSDDGGQTFGNPLIESFGGTGEFLYFPTFKNLGQGRDRVFEISFSAPIVTAISGIFVEAEKASR